MFSCKFYKDFKNNFFIIALDVTPSESSTQATCLDIIIKTSTWHQLHQYFWLYYQLQKCFLFVEITLAATIQKKFSKSRIFSRKSWHKIQLCEKFSSVNLYLFDVIFSVTAWTNRLHDFNEGICFPDKCCCENE